MPYYTCYETELDPKMWEVYEKEVEADNPGEAAEFFVEWIDSNEELAINHAEIKITVIDEDDTRADFIVKCSTTKIHTSYKCKYKVSRFII